MGKLSDRVQRISESQTIAMARKSRELKAQGIDIISLSLGEPDFPTPDIIKDAAKKAIDDNFSYYTHVSGYLEIMDWSIRPMKLWFQPVPNKA
jgi:aspartate aminotransferase